MKRDSFNINGKIFEIIPAKSAPCTSACPLGTNVKAYVSLIAARRFAEALEVVRLTNPFPGICGRVCPHPCEDDCLRADVDEPVSIADLKRFIADYELRRGIIPGYSKKMNATKMDVIGRVAIIGAGPAGLTCAADLARVGCRVTVFEARARAGGMLTYGIPAYRLPKDILDVEIGAIEAMGVEIKLNTRVGVKPRFDELLEQFDALFIASGAPKPRKLGIPGEQEVRKGLCYWDNFLAEASAGNRKNPGERVVVIGGGNTAVDCARVALRLGSKDVCILYRRTRKEMPAFRDEIDEAEEEGIKIQFLVSPIRIVHQGGKLSGVECVRMRLSPGRERDKTGRRMVVPESGSNFFIPCDLLIPAVGQELDTSFLGEIRAPGLNSNGFLAVNPETLETSLKGVFAGGDAAGGPGNILDAILSGHRAAESILRRLSGDKLYSMGPGQFLSGKEFSIGFALPSASMRLEGKLLPPDMRKSSFNEVKTGLTELEAVEEAGRCLRCGFCEECLECVVVCGKKQLIIEPRGKRRAVNKKIELLQVSVEFHRKVILNEGVLSLYSSGKRVSSFTARVNETLCRGCGLCEEACPYRAIQVVYRDNRTFTAKVNDDACRGCGSCVSVCPTGAIDQYYFGSGWIKQVTSKILRSAHDEPDDVIFACRWGSSLDNIPENLRKRVLQVMCLGSIGAGDIIKAFENGARSITLLGCGDGKCHYGSGLKVAKDNVMRVSAVLKLFGFTEGRLRLIDNPRKLNI